MDWFLYDNGLRLERVKDLWWKIVVLKLDYVSEDYL